MSYVFSEDKLDRVARLQRHRDQIRFNAGWVKHQDMVSLVEHLHAMAKRIAAG